MARLVTPKEQRGAALCRAMEVTARLVLGIISKQQGNRAAASVAAEAVGAMTWPDIQAMLGYASGRMDSAPAAAQIFSCWYVALIGYGELVSKLELSDPRSSARYKVLHKLLAQALLQSEPLAAALLRLQPSVAEDSSDDTSAATQILSSNETAYVFGLQLVLCATVAHRGEGEGAQPPCLQAPLLQHWLGHCTVLAQAAEVGSLPD